MDVLVPWEMHNVVPVHPFCLQAVIIVGKYLGTLYQGNKMTKIFRENIVVMLANPENLHCDSLIEVHHRYSTTSFLTTVPLYYKLCLVTLT